jgi:23S rRNA-/tRNA-specific pseudouridylate synthase
LKDLGELLDNGTSGLVVVARTNATTMVEDATTRATRRANAQFQADVDAMKKELTTI